MYQLSVSISGSFHRHIIAIEEAVDEFHARGVLVLSPKEPRIIDSIGEFLFVASDNHKSIRLVQDSHLSAIYDSDFLWLVAPDGYVGQSASLEIGYAIACDIPIFCERLPPDLTLREYIQKVNNIDDAIKLTNVQVECETLFDKTSPILIDPPNTIDIVHRKLDSVEYLLEKPNYDGDNKVAVKIRTELGKIEEMISLPS